MSLDSNSVAKNRLSQQDRILLMLNEAGSAGCTSEDLLHVSHRFSGRVYDLRQKGWNITTQDRPGTEMVVYVLHPDVVQHNQPDLLQQVPPAKPSAAPATGLCVCGHVKGWHSHGKDGCSDCMCSHFTEQVQSDPGRFTLEEADGKA